VSLVPVALPIASGTTFFNKYDFVHCIGRGAFGEVWLAKDMAVNHEYAVKILKPGLNIDQRLREAQVGHTFSHNNLVRVHQADVATDGKVLLAMDYFPGGSVTTLANPWNFVPLPTALRIVIDMLQGLAHLHTHNFFHNDVKPQNILRGPEGQAKLADYGIVGISTDGKPVLPTSWYVLHAAPETAVGNGIEARTDIFQTGLTLFRLLAGLDVLEEKYRKLDEAAYQDALARGNLIAAADFPAFVPSAVRRVVTIAIDPDPGKRFQSALEMRRALEKLSFAGYWTVDATGKLIGTDARNNYRFERSCMPGAKVTLTALKINKASQRETRIARFSDDNMNEREAKKKLDAFIAAVVAGNVS